MSLLHGVDRPRRTADAGTPAPGEVALATPAAWGNGATILLVISGFLVALRRAEAPYADGDLLWSARAGRDMLSTGHLPHSDAYSWTVHGSSWLPNSWGWDAVLGATDRVAGLAGIALLGVLMTGLVALAAGIAARRAGATPAWTALLFQIVVGVFAVFFYARAQIVDYVAVFAIPLLSRRALTAPRRRFVLAAVSLTAAQAVWMNLHSAALLGPLLVGATCAGWLLTARNDRAAIACRSVALTVLSAAACIATPYGVAPITHAEAVRRASAGLISEWRPVGIASPEQLLGVAALLIGLVACWLAARARRYETVAVLLVLGVATAGAIRFSPMVVLCALPEIAAAASRIRVRPAFLNRVCALALVIFAVACVAGMRGFAQAGSQYASPSLVGNLPSGCRLLNDMSIGGAVIRSRPDVLVSIDSRNDLYGRQREIVSIKQLLDPVAGLAIIRSAHITCVLAPTQAPLVTALREQPGWRVAGTDSVRTLLLWAGS